MSATNTSLYASGAQAFLSGAIAATDTFKIALVLATYTPQLTSDSSWSAISSYEASGTGYTAGGQVLTSVGTGVLTSVGVAARISNTAYSLDQTVTVGSYVYVCVSSGTTAITAPTFPTVQGLTVVDGGATWACLGAWVAYLTSATASWNPLSLTNVRYGVIYDVTASGQLLVLVDLGSGQTLTGPWGLQPDPNTGWVMISG